MLEGDYSLGGGWGCSIQLSNPDEFMSTDLNEETVRVHGWQSRIPKEGDTLVGEFNRSFIKFEFVKVVRESDPPDMFFADVKGIDQEMKETV